MLEIAGHAPDFIEPCFPPTATWCRPARSGPTRSSTTATGSFAGETATACAYSLGAVTTTPTGCPRSSTRWRCSPPPRLRSTARVWCATARGYPTSTCSGQRSGATARVRSVLYAFDLLELDGQDLRREPWETRRATLAGLLRKVTRGIQLSEHIDGSDGEAVFHHACRMGLEGVVAKRLLFGETLS
jgi:hypothetical protein